MSFGGWPSLMAGKINRCYDSYDSLLPLEKIPADAYLDKSALKSVTDKEVYDLSPTWENYARLTDNEKGLGLARSVDNYDRMTLLYIMDKGYPRDGLIDKYPDNFSFHEPFEEIESRLLGRDRWNVYDEMQEKAKMLAASLLHEHFPNMRQIEKGAPEVKVEKAVEKRVEALRCRMRKGLFNYNY